MLRRVTLIFCLGLALTACQSASQSDGGQQLVAKVLCMFAHDSPCSAVNNLPPDNPPR